MIKRIGKRLYQVILWTEYAVVLTSLDAEMHTITMSRKQFGGLKNGT